MTQWEDDVLAALRSIRSELAVHKTLLGEMATFMRDAEAEVPESMRRFANYFHDWHDIKFIYEEHGVEVPDYVLREIERLHDRARQLIKTLKMEGGVFNKVLREMAADRENRYDHTKQLPSPKENGKDETRTSE
jgi:hypothetical protein